MSLDKLIENKKEALYLAISINGVMAKDTIKASEELDKLIVMRMGLGYKKA